MLLKFSVLPCIEGIHQTRCVLPIPNCFFEILDGEAYQLIISTAFSTRKRHIRLRATLAVIGLEVSLSYNTSLLHRRTRGFFQCISLHKLYQSRRDDLRPPHVFSATSDSRWVHVITAPFTTQSSLRCCLRLRAVRKQLCCSCLVGQNSKVSSDSTQSRNSCNLLYDRSAHYTVLSSTTFQTKEWKKLSCIFPETLPEESPSRIASTVVDKWVFTTLLYSDTTFHRSHATNLQDGHIVSVRFYVMLHLVNI